jgi:hypothetical protein
MANLHPADLTQIMRDYDGFKNEKLKPDDVEKRIEDMQRKGLYCTDPRSVVPPKSGLDKKGNPKPWDALDDNEKAEAYAKYRNSVMAASFALRKQVISTYKDMGLPENVAKTLAMTKLSRRPGETLRDRAARSEDVADQVFDEILSRNQPPREYTPDEIKTTMELAGLDPMAKNILVAEFQAIDYLRARQKYLHGAPEDQIDERDSPRSIVARLREASDELRKSDKKYPPAYRRQSMAETFRKRVLTRLMALNPDKASKIEPEFRKMDADDYDTRKAEVDELTDKFKKDSAAYEKALERIQKEFNDERAEAEPPADGRIYRMTPVVQSVKKRLAEEGIQEPIPPPLLPDKPAGYDEIRSSPRGIVEKGKKLWNLLRHGLPSKSRTASERIVDRYLAFSTCEPGLAMGTPSKHNASVSKTGLYWGVDQPSKGNAVNVPYASWGQAHARDLGEKDYGSILTAAREWLKVPVLSRVLDVEESLGAAHDIQLRAALDLAIRDHEGGKYSVGLHPTVYNNLLARLAGKPTASPLLTQREASKSLYIPATGEDSPMNAASKIRKMAADIVAMNPGLAFDLTNLAFEVQAEQSKSAGEIPEAFKENIQKKKDEAKDKDQGQEQDKQASGKYAALRTAVIRTAAQNPTVRPALVPILQMIKEQG